MIILTSIFVIYFFLLNILGGYLYDFIFDTLNLRKKERIFEVNKTIFFPLITLFVFSSFALIMNFFLGLDYFYFFIIPTALFFFVKYRSHFVEDLKYHFRNNYIYSIIVPCILSVFFIDLNFNYDAALYNLKYQQYLLDSKIIINGTIFDGHFGLTQIGDYLSAVHTTNENYIFSYFPNLAIYTIFFNIIYAFLFSKSNYFFQIATSVLIFGALDNFGSGGGRNGYIYFENLGKTDVVFSILFFLSGIFLYNCFSKDSIHDCELFILLIFITFSIQYRFMGYIFLTLFIFFVVKKKVVVNYKILKYFVTLIILWIIRNVLLTSCFIFPVDSFCIANKSLAREFRQIIRNYNRAYEFGDDLFLWFDEWVSLSLNKSITINFLVTVATILIIRYVFFIKINRKSKLIPLFFIFYTSILVLGSPDFRFAVGIILLFISSFYINYELKKRFIFFKNKSFKNILFCFCLIFTLRITSFTNYFSEILNIKILPLTSVEMIARDDGFVRPAEGDQCWFDMNCTLADNSIYKKDIFGYTVFEIQD